jgi:DNA repair protein RecN (Recombination protein N)
VNGTVYGGGQIGRVENDATVIIGVETPTNSTPAPIIAGNVFGAGAGKETHGYSALLRGDGKLTIQGMDTVTFLISANKGEIPKPISKIASGGELSRIMLALKSVIADRDSIPTLIFDEIDTGVSGRAAQKIGIKLREISRSRQVLCVTHLSQIAVMADTQFMIEKHDENDRTVTQVHLLDFEGRVQEIARIMGGENPSELMLRNAREELIRVQEGT